MTPRACSATRTHERHTDGSFDESNSKDCRPDCASGGWPDRTAAWIQAALRRVRSDDLRLPDAADADDRLRAIVQRAIARDPGQRYDTAANLRDALMQWLEPVMPAGPAVPEA